MNPCAPVEHRTLRVLLADDHEMVRLALRHALAGLAPSVEWHEADDAAAVERALGRERDIDLALIDLHMHGAGDVGWIAGLRASHPTVPIVVLSGSEDAALVRALIAHGVAGYIPKSDSAAVILQAVRLVLSGGSYVPLRLLANGASPPRVTGTLRPFDSPMELTPRQSEVLRLLARGLPNKLIARELALAEGTVKVHLLAIFRALGVRNRTQAVVAAQKRLRADGHAVASPGVPRSL